MTKRRERLIKLPYWLGIAADALWAVALLFPRVFAFVTLDPEFAPDPQTRLIMGIGFVLMTGWTLLLIWGVRRPIERRAVILLTAFPVVAGMFVVSLLSVVAGTPGMLWVVIKTVVLMATMTMSYVLAGREVGS